MPNDKEHFVGIDVANEKLDVAVKVTEEGQPPRLAKRAHEAWIAPNTTPEGRKQNRRV